MKKVLVVDDSALVRKQLVALIEEIGFECDVARHGQEAVDKAKVFDYSCITMDINMPIKDGITALGEIMEINPTPVVMVSSLTSGDAQITFDALDLGAIDYVLKPGTLNSGAKENGDEILQKIKAASRISKRRIQNRAQTQKSSTFRKKEREPKATRERREIAAPISYEFPKGVVLIGASTGGPNLIEEICASLPSNFPHPVCIVQHMPEKFTEAFAKRLDNASELSVKEAAHNDEITKGNIYLAKGGSHMHFAKKVSGKVVVRLSNDQNGRFFIPSVDEMFFSSLSVFDPKTIVAVELTGIGDDGADGMVAIKKAGGYTIAESEESAVVYGMPKEAFLRGGTCEVLSFDKIVRKLKTYR